MNEISKRRHDRARKILIDQCNNSVKEFAKRIERSEQQASNFLRENTKTKIGDKLARIIERSFDLPDFWLDVNNDSYENKNLSMKLISDFSDARKALQNILERSDDDAISNANLHFTLKSIANLKRKVNHIFNLYFMKYEASVLYQLQDVLNSKNLELIFDEELNALHNESFIFILETKFTTRAFRNNYLRNLNMSYLFNQQKIFRVYPFFTIDDDLSFYFVEVDEMMQKIGEHIASELRLKKQIQDNNKIDLSSIDDELTMNINNHPSLNKSFIS
jgi:plasmid maintenance system antidote protein VapI